MGKLFDEVVRLHVLKKQVLPGSDEMRSMVSYCEKACQHPKKPISFESFSAAVDALGRDPNRF